MGNARSKIYIISPSSVELSAGLIDLVEPFDVLWIKDVASAGQSKMNDMETLKPLNWNMYRESN